MANRTADFILKSVAQEPRDNVDAGQAPKKLALHEKVKPSIEPDLATAGKNECAGINF